MNTYFSSSQEAILLSPCVMIVEKPSTTSITGQSTNTNYSLSVAINKYVAEATQLQSYSVNDIKNGLQNSTLYSSIDRLMSFMTDNGKGTLAYYADSYLQMFLQAALDSQDYDAKVITILLIVDPIVIVLLLILFIPFIFHVQTNLLKIYTHLCQFKDVDIHSWVEQCDSSSNDIKASITRMKKIFAAESFEIVILRDEDKKNINKKCEEKPVAKHGKEEEIGNQDTNQNTTLKSTESPLTKQSNDDEERLAMVQSKEEAVAERKQTMFYRMTKEKTKEYLILLLIFSIYIGIFRAADALVFSDAISQANSRRDYFNTIFSREKSHAMSMFFFREELLANNIQSYFDCI